MRWSGRGNPPMTTTGRRVFSAESVRPVTRSGATKTAPGYRCGRTCAASAAASWESPASRSPVCVDCPCLCDPGSMPRRDSVYDWSLPGNSFDSSLLTRQITFTRPRFPRAGHRGWPARCTVMTIFTEPAIERSCPLGIASRDSVHRDRASGSPRSGRGRRYLRISSVTAQRALAGREAPVRNPSAAPP